MPPRRARAQGDSRRLGDLYGLRVAPHDQRVLAIVRVIAPTDPAWLEARALIQADRDLVRDTHLERVAAPALPRGQLEQVKEQHGRDLAPPVFRRDRDVHHVPRVDVPGDDQVPEQNACPRVESAERERRRLRQLAGEHRARPRRRVGRALDRFDRVEIAQLEPPELEAVVAHFDTVVSASGSRRYRGSTASAGPKSRASCAWNRARGRWRSSPSGGISAPAASRMARYRTAPFPTHTVPAPRRRSAGASTRGSPSRTKTSRRRASITGVAPGAPAASAARVDTPATGSSSASASPRAVASPTRTPVKLPGPIPTASASRSPWCAPPWRSRASTSSSSVTARDTRSPRTSPSATSALVATSVAVSNARISIRDRHDSRIAPAVLDADGEPRRRERALPRLRPFDEHDCAVEIRLQVAPLGGREPAAPVEIEV